MKKGRGSRLSLYDKVYRELDATFIGAERQRNVPGLNKERYDYLREMSFMDDNSITIHSDTPERLDFAQKVAEYYGASYERVEELWRRDPKERYKIKINIIE